MEGAAQIEVAVIDMSSQFRSAIEQALPQAKIIIDRFHIGRMANGAIDTTRKRLLKEAREKDKKEKMCHATMLRRRRQKLKKHQRKYLKKWFERYPVLGRAYYLKRLYCLMWKSKSEIEARQFYEKWSRHFAQTMLETPEQAALRNDFKELLTAMSNWGKYVFNYFDSLDSKEKKFTNAFTEGANRRIRDIRRESRRAGIPVLRAKLIYGGWLKKRLEEEQKLWGKSRVQPTRTRRPSEKKPGKGLNSKSTNKTVARRQASGGQQSLFEW